MAYSQKILNFRGSPQALSQAQAAAAALKESKLRVLAHAAGEDDLPAIEQMAARITGRFRTLLVMGMGASSLGGETLLALAAPGGSTEVRFVSNIDPVSAERLLASLDFASTAFLIISKSGDTAETLAHFLIWLAAAEKKLGKDKAREHFFIVTQPGDGALRKIATARGLPILDHDPHIGGRYASLTAVGLLPAKVAGIDIRAARRGARAMLKGDNSEAAQGAALHFALIPEGKTISVLMPYCDRLLPFSMWHRQLWAESIGKQGKGGTPAPALGATDQHSQLQLYLDGPRDKVFTLICLPHAGKGPAIPASGEPTLSYLKGAIGDLMEAEQRATCETLVKSGAPLRTLRLKTLDEETLGALMMHMMLETMIMARLLGIDAFDQPAVEEGKKLARGYLAGAGSAA